MSFLDVATVVIVFILTDQATRRLRIFYRRNWPAIQKRRNASKKYMESFQTVLDILWPDKNINLKQNREWNLQISLREMDEYPAGVTKFWGEMLCDFQLRIDLDLRDRAERVYIARIEQKAVRDEIEKFKKGILKELSRHQLDGLYKKLHDANAVEDAATKVFWRHHDATALLGFKTYPDIWAHRCLKV
jgi:hypothetical protein